MASNKIIKIFDIQLIYRLTLYLFRNKIFLGKNFHILQYLFCSKIFGQRYNIFSKSKQPRKICVKYFTLEILVKHFTFCALSQSWYSTYLFHSHALLVFSPKLNTPWSFYPTYHRLYLRHHPSPAPPFTGATHHWLLPFVGATHHQLHLGVFSPVILHYCHRLHHFLATSIVINSSTGS